METTEYKNKVETLKAKYNKEEVNNSIKQKNKAIVGNKIVRK